MDRRPVRTCVGCRTRAPKAELLRLVVTPGGVRPDPSATAPGRGAYVHRDRACIADAMRKGALARALRVGLRGDELATLEGRIEEALQDR